MKGHGCLCVCVCEPVSVGVCTSHAHTYLCVCQCVYVFIAYITSSPGVSHSGKYFVSWQQFGGCWIVGGAQVRTSDLPPKHKEGLTPAVRQQVTTRAREPSRTWSTGKK